ncbi:MAG: hypothetical protein IPG45_27645 [Deltaproteobacteria bacterium]|nr:hypothetical protein [Deltaproteobacteria bacterium]
MIRDRDLRSAGTIGFVGMQGDPLCDFRATASLHWHQQALFRVSKEPVGSLVQHLVEATNPSWVETILAIRL